MDQYTQVSRLISIGSPPGDDRPQLTAFDGSEHVPGLFEWELAALSPDAASKPDGLISREAQMSAGWTGWSLFFAGLVNSAACMANEAFVCPATVRLSSATVAPEDIPAGYEAWVSDSIIRLSGNNLYDGPPRYMAQLKPEFSKGNVTTWMLHPGKYPQGVWASCDYAGGLVTIASRVSDSATSCVATTEKVKPHNTLAVRFVCKGER